jgi:hypothetical protein
LKEVDLSVQKANILEGTTLTGFNLLHSSMDEADSQKKFAEESESEARLDLGELN